MKNHTPPKKISLQTLTKLARKLRSKKGCPWDRKQTIETMVEHLNEEVCEIEEAVKNKDWDNLKEEIGDVLFQLIMIAQIASEQKLFKLNDSLKMINDKIISRHTWVFGDDKAKTPEEALELWKRNKEIEKKKK